MKVIVGFSRIFVGIFFIISGLIKLNDPIGFAFKLEEYFGPTVLDLPFFTPYALGISIFVVVFEVLLGIFLIIGYKPKFTVWSLFLMILFFTFLTFYSAYFDKVKDCGCFGDAMKMTPWQSFLKDLGLLALILIVFTQVKYIKPFFGKFATTIISLLSFIACLWFGYHVLMHLPAKDYRPYKIDSNIIDNMTVPEDAPKAVQEFTWVLELENGEQKEFVTNGPYPNVEGKYISHEVDIIKEGYEAPIHDFSIEKDGEDLTEAILLEDNLILVVAYNLEKAEANGLKAIKEATDKAIKNGYTVAGLTATGPEEVAEYKTAYNLNFDFYFCDETALKTIVRSNPGVLKVQKATIKQKLHFNDIDQLELPVVERKPEPKPEPVAVTNVLYYVDGELVTKEDVDMLSEDLIEKMEVVKDSTMLKEMNITNTDSIIKITLKQ